MNERIEAVDRLRRWTDVIPLHYEYTAGIAGEKFLNSLKDARLVGGRCERCELTFLPPKIYCVKCFGRVERIVRLPSVGKVAATSTSGGEKGECFVFVTFEGVVGGLVHYSVGGVPKIGGRVRIRFKRKAERRGSIIDIEGFEPA